MKKKNYILWFWRIIYPMIVYLVIASVAQIPFMFFFAQTAAAEANGDAILMQTLLFEKLTSASNLILLFSAVFAFPIFFFLMRRDRKKQQKNTGIFTYESTTMSQYIMIGILGIVFCTGVNNLISYSHIIELFPGYMEVATMIYGSGIGMQLLVVGIAAPIIEELLFRGLVYKRMREYCKPGLAIALSGLLFGIYHMNMVQGIYASLLGFLLGYVYEKFHTIAAPIIFHILANITSIVSSEIGRSSGVFENLAVTIPLTVLSCLVMIGILIKFRKIEQTYTVEPPIE